MKKTGPHKPVAGFTSTTHAFPSPSTAVVMPNRNQLLKTRHLLWSERDVAEWGKAEPPTSN